MRRIAIVAVLAVCTAFSTGSVFARPIDPYQRYPLPPGTHCMPLPDGSGMLGCEAPNGQQFVCQPDLSDCTPQIWHDPRQTAGGGMRSIQSTGATTAVP
jgi:hypothetical protein